MNTPRFYIPIRPMPPLPHPSWVESWIPPERGPHGPRAATAAADHEHDDEREAA